MKKHSIITIGTFDGLHKGHQHLISNLISLSKELGLKPVVLVLPMPTNFYIGKDNFLGSLTTTLEKMQLLKEWVEEVHLLDFDEIRNLPPEVFVEEHLIKRYGMKSIMVGYDFKFGKDRRGDFEFLKKYSKGRYKVFKSLPYKIKGITVSSSIIRKLLREGDVEKANFFLGRDYFINGVVVKGMKLARKIGFPTANIKFDPYKIVPSLGVYALKTIVEERPYDSIGYIGMRETNGVKHQNIEVHIFELSKDLYSKPITIVFKNFIRKPMKFNNMQEAKNQINYDIIKVRSLLS